MNEQEIDNYIDQEIKAIPQANTHLVIRSLLKFIRQYHDVNLSNVSLTPGPQGIPGPIGPAGLEWQGLFDSETEYQENDAVSFQGASYFCYSGPTTGSDPITKVESWALLAAMGLPGPIGPAGNAALILSAKIYQQGTTIPQLQFPQIDTVRVGQSWIPDSDYRDVITTRQGPGEYEIILRWVNVPTNVNKCALNFGFAGVYVLQQNNGITGGYNYTKWTIQTRNTAGDLADNILLGNNGGYMTLTIYP